MVATIDTIKDLSKQKFHTQNFISVYTGVLTDYVIIIKGR